jgi:ribosomal protein S18 acetylase RimI-like enzyme
MNRYDDTEITKEPNRSVKIRPTRPDDLPFLRSLALEAFSIYGDYETILTDFFLTEGVYTYLVEYIRTPPVLPIGILMMVVRKPCRGEPRFAEIVAIAVDQDHQGQGVGSCMIEFAKQWPRHFFRDISIPEVHLSVAESNVRGRSFFENHGFEVLRKEPWTYPAGQGALRMRYVVSI